MYSSTLVISFQFLHNSVNNLILSLPINQASKYYNTLQKLYLSYTKIIWVKLFHLPCLKQYCVELFYSSV